MPVIVIILAGLGVAALLLVPIEWLSYLFSDDAYYYLKTAQNAVAGAGLSFDGLERTNGFHPLWMLVNLVIAETAANLEWQLRWLASVQWLLYVCVIALSCSLWRTGWFKAVGTAVLCIVASPLVLGVNGLETTLLLLVLFGILALDRNHQFLALERAPRDKALFGLLLGLLALTRLDTVFLLFGLAAVMLVRWAGGPIVGHILRLIRVFAPTVLVFLAVLAPYFYWNYQEFGHLLPISGDLKASFPYLSARYGLLLKEAPSAIGVVVALAVMLAYATERIQVPMLRQSSPANRWLLVAFAFGCLLHFLWSMFFMAWGTHQWHFASYVPVMVIAAVALAGWTTTRFGMSDESLAVLSLVAMLVANGLLVAMKGSHHLERIEAARWVQDHLPEDVVIGLRDAGVFGYFSQRAVINLDGLINGYEYQEAIEQRDLESYFEKRGMRYLADAYTPCDYTVRQVLIFRHLGQPDAVHIALANDKRNEIYRVPSNGLCFVIWKYDPSGLRYF